MLTQKRITGLLLALWVFYYGCSKDSPVAPPSTERSAIATSIRFSHVNFAASALDSLILTVTGEGVTQIHKSLTIEGTKARTQLEVPADKVLIMSATGYQDTTAVLYGEQQFTAEKGKVTSVTITLDFLVPTIILSPPDTTLQTGDQITIHLAARNVAEMATFGAQVEFDPTTLKVVELGRVDAFLKTNHGSVMQLEFNNDNEAGAVKAVLGIFPASAAVTGSGDIGEIVFEALQPDTTDIRIRIDNLQNSDLGLFDKNADLMYSVGLGSRLYIQSNVQ